MDQGLENLIILFIRSFCSKYALHVGYVLIVRWNYSALAEFTKELGKYSRKSYITLHGAKTMKLTVIFYTRYIFISQGKINRWKKVDDEALCAKLCIMTKCFRYYMINYLKEVADCWIAIIAWWRVYTRDQCLWFLLLLLYTNCEILVKLGTVVQAKLWILWWWCGDYAISNK